MAAIIQPVITGQSILASNGPLPTSVRFGFAGSTGGSRNIHEIMCFQAQPQNTASSSAGLNQKQTAKVQTGTQVYFAFYNANNWTGSLTSQYLDSPDGNPNDLQIDPNVNWDASCVLTGLAEGATCPTTGVTSRRGRGSGCRTSHHHGDQPRTASPGKPGRNPSRHGHPVHLDDRGRHQLIRLLNRRTWITAIRRRRRAIGHTSQIYGWSICAACAAMNRIHPGSIPIRRRSIPAAFAQRTSVLGDIVDSSPTWVGGPSATFPATWTDNLNTGTALPENSGPSYASFQSTYVSRMNVVYSGANDGFLHGFRTGYFNSNGKYDGATNTSGTFVGTENDGTEVLAYMPAYVVNAINSSTTLNTSTGATSPNVANDYTNPQYAHKFNVDGTPGTGDLYYGGAWHTWLVGGLGAGGSAIYALDITNPGHGADVFEQHASRKAMPRPWSSASGAVRW